MAGPAQRLHLQQSGIAGDRSACQGSVTFENTLMGHFDVNSLNVTNINLNITISNKDVLPQSPANNLHCGSDSDGRPPQTGTLSQKNPCRHMAHGGAGSGIPISTALPSDRIAPPKQQMGQVEHREESEEESDFDGDSTKPWSETETEPMPDPSDARSVLLRGVRRDRTRSPRVEGRSPRPSLRRSSRMSLATFSTDANGSM